MRGRGREKASAATATPDDGLQADDDSSPKKLLGKGVSEQTKAIFRSVVPQKDNSERNKNVEGTKIPPTRTVRPSKRSIHPPPPSKRPLSEVSAPALVASRKRVRPSKQQAKEKQFLFLALSGEIRNMVYFYAIEVMKTWDKKHRDTDTQNPWGRRILYLALTQSCRIIRSEFRDLWMDNFSVYSAEVASFIGSFLRRPTFHSRINTAEMYTKTSGTFVLAAGLGDVPGSLLELVKLCMACPEYKLKFDTQNASGRDYRQTIFNIVTNKNRRWKKAVQSGGIVHIKFEGTYDRPPGMSHPPHNKPTIVFYLTETYLLRWDDYDTSDRSLCYYTLPRVHGLVLAQSLATHFRETNSTLQAAGYYTNRLHNMLKAYYREGRQSPKGIR